MARLFSLLGLLGLVLVANWPYVYEEVLDEQFGNGIPLIPGVVTATQQPPPTFAGWPYKFYLSVGGINELRVTSFNWSALLLNICFWSLVPITFLLYEKYFFRRTTGSDKLEIEHVDWGPDAIQEPPNDLTPEQKAEQNLEKLPEQKPPHKPKRQTLRLADIFVVTALVSCVFGYWQVLRNRGELDKKLATEIGSKGGGAKRVAILPWLGRNLLRVGGHSASLRITEVRLANPDDALLAKVVALPYLRTLNISGGSYDFRTLNRLSTNPLLSELGIVGRSLKTDAIVAIRSLQSLRKLNLMRTNITAAGLAAIEQPQLTELNLIHTDVQLAELGRPAFAKSMRKLRLPHPGKGTGGSLRLEDWPELVELSCSEYDELLNRAPVAITLKNLPKLASVELDGLQMFDIDFEQLPSLAKLEPTFLQWEQRTSSKQIVPSFLWVGKLRLKDVPKLKELSIFAADTHSIEIDQDSMTFGLCVFNKGAYRDPPGTGSVVMGMGGVMEILEPGYLTPAELPLETRQKWIDDIAKCRGLESADLELVPLKGVKLSSLVSNKSIRQLMLGKSGVLGSQLGELKGMDQLEVLSLVGAHIDGRTIEWLTKTFPNLRQIICEQSMVQRLRVEHIPNLESIFEKPKTPVQSMYPRFSDANAMDALRIVDAPKLRDHFVLRGKMLLVHIDAAPALTGLSFQEPLPVNTVIKGVHDLKFFAAGGPTCTDTIVNEVLNCAGLKRLTLAYTNLMPATFNRVADLRDLEYLMLTGSNVNAQAIESLANLENLRELRLDQTPISQASISGIAKLKNLETLDLGGIRLTSDDVSRLVQGLSKLKRVTLIGAELTTENMQQIAKLGDLQSLDLSNCELNDELLHAFCESPPAQLVELKLNSAKLGEVGFQNLVRKLRSTRFALKDTEVNPQLMDILVTQNRVTEFESDEDGMFGMVGGPRVNFGTGRVEIQNMETLPVGDIDPQTFAPNYKDPN